MKKTISIIIVIILFGCNDQASIDDPKKRNENWCWFVVEQTGEGKWVPIGNETTLKDGNYTLFFCNGEIRRTGKLKDGKDCDTIYNYDIIGALINKIFQDQNGKLQEIMLDGKYKGYYSTCELSVEGEIKGNKQVGKRIEYYKNGNIKKQSEEGNALSWYSSYNEQGQVLDSATFVNGKLNGFAYDWYINGQLESIRYFTNDLLNGYCIFYHENGQVKQTRKYVNDIPQDTVKDWYDNGQLRFIKQYKDGEKIGLERTWHTNGNTRSVFSFMNDKKHGDYIMYYENGVKQREGKYNLEVKIGIWCYYDEKGNLTETKNYN